MSAAQTDIEVSVVMPCLNEADTLAACIEKAQIGLRGVAGEIIVADNGSTDGSVEIAEKLGARVVAVTEKGYGHALRGGIAAAQGKYVVMGDADDSYDFREIPKFVAKLREGFELVQGCRLPSGGGEIKPGAMPFSHRWIGNPALSQIVRSWFRSPVHDVYSGMRAFTRDLYDRLGLRFMGMEFATEMVIKAGFAGARITEVPITLYPDGRKAHAPHLNTLRDGWRTLRMFLMFSPRWLFLFPGFALIALGLLGYAVALPGLQVGRVIFDAHTLLFASVAILCGYQAVLFAIFTKTFGVNIGLLPPDPRMDGFYKVMYLERGLLLGAATCVVGIGLLLAAFLQWKAAGFGRLDYAVTMRWVIPGATLTALGCQTLFSSFFTSILGLLKR